MTIAKKSCLIASIGILGFSRSLKDNEKLGQSRKIYIALS